MTQQVAFYLNQARPSFILETDQQIDKATADQLRERWEAQTKWYAGHAILAWGLKAKAITVGANDASLAEMLKLSEQNIALAFRMPLQILGIGGTPFASTEARCRLGNNGARLRAESYRGSLRLAVQVEGLSENTPSSTPMRCCAHRSRNGRAVERDATGDARINEGRRMLDLPAVAGGDEILVQQQDIPLSMAGKTSRLHRINLRPVPLRILRRHRTKRNLCASPSV